MLLLDSFAKTTADNQEISDRYRMDHLKLARRRRHYVAIVLYYSNVVVAIRTASGASALYGALYSRGIVAKVKVSFFSTCLQDIAVFCTLGQPLSMYHYYN